LRITGGQARGRIIPSPKGGEVRPTASKIRQALFNVLRARVTGARFLDLFAGTGLIGIEALSRGAQSLVAVEHNRKMAQSIEASLQQLGFQAEVICADVSKVLQNFGRNQKTNKRIQFDIIFADPPYKSALASKILREIDANDLLDLHGVLIIEHAKGFEFPSDLEHLKIRSTRDYGDTVLTFIGIKNT
jgi:16S rRNA (guanine(966)-N(2))-methyltransferase RsmD